MGQGSVHLEPFEQAHESRPISLGNRLGRLAFAHKVLDVGVVQIPFYFVELSILCFY